MKKEKEISLDDASRELDKGVAGADTMRVGEMEHLQTVLGARDATLSREQERLTRKLGPTHSRIAKMAARIDFNRGLMSEVTAETARARTEVPDVDDKTWVLHGYVRDENGVGIVGLTAALYDDRAVWVEQLGFACTRANGYFRLSSENLGNINRPVFIRVLDRQGTHLYEDSLQLTPTGGRVDYREITLSAGGRACAPPGESRNDPGPGGDGGQGGDDDDDDAREGWVVRGRVTDAKGEGVAGLVVRLYDKDFFFDDRLGECETGEDGNYSLKYATGEFRDFFERKPDLYLKVFDRQGKMLYSSKREVRHEAGRVETIDVTLGGK